MNYKIIATLVGATLLAASVRYYFPKVETKTVTKTVTQVREHTITRIVKQPDGTTTTIIDSTTSTDTTKAKSATKASVSNWHASASASLKALAQPVPVYGVQLERRIIGPIFVGAKLDTDKQIGVSLGIEF